MVETRPDLIIESGTFRGGSALYLASVCDAIDRGTILSIDLRLAAELPQHPRIEYLEGSSTDPAVVGQAHERTAEDAGSWSYSTRTTAVSTS
jgi:cephalosporin hydroxylase